MNVIFAVTKMLLKHSIVFIVRLSSISWKQILNNSLGDQGML